MALDSSVGKWVAVALLAGGEALAIYAEMLAARTPGALSGVLSAELLPLFLFMTLAGGMLLGGYWLGYAAFRNIWIVTAASITSILIVEPVLAFSLFKETPTKGAVVGLVLGAIGLVAAAFF